MHHMAGLLYHGVTGVVMGQGKYNARLFDHVNQLFGFCQGIGHGFVADDMDARISKNLGNREMHLVGCYD